MRKGARLVKYRIFETEQFLGDLTQDFEGRGERLRKKLLEYVYPPVAQQSISREKYQEIKNYKPDT